MTINTAAAAICGLVRDVFERVVIEDGQSGANSGQCHSDRMDVSAVTLVVWLSVSVRGSNMLKLVDLKSKGLS